MYMVDQKARPQTHDHNSVKYEPIKNLLEDSVVKFILKIPPHLAYVVKH